MKGLVIVVLAMLVIAEFMVQPNEAITCTAVNKLLGSCLNFLKEGGTPPLSCCDDLQRIQNATPTKADRQTACCCAKETAIAYAFNETFARDIAAKCRITLSVPISPTVDCSTVSL
ncbi:non-specific lipid-transfer protein AP10-like [Bidens hawaiensis]|uniref:non-specific lipid-transfer protein AP10-like n=1 Tax=Bidens hawaiensis TaxID=980011 RepID=UPI00404B2CA2